MSYLNNEGLTFRQWLQAALHAARRKPTAQELSVLRKEWRADVDPTEWAAYLSQ